MRTACAELNALNLLHHFTKALYSVKHFKSKQPFLLESGVLLPELDIAYCTYGELNAAQDNVIWICHALTANADAADWWNGLVGEGKIFDPEYHFIICANIIGSCYGSTSPQSINPTTGERYGRDFPLVTIRDMVAAHQLLQQHLGIHQIKFAIGGSMGGQQVLEWAITDPDLFENICLLATNARHSPWGIAFNEAQRMAIEADPTIYDATPEAGKRGIEAARAIAMLSYRNYKTYQYSQSEENLDKIDDFRAGSYQRYQGLKLQRRFHVLSYLALSKAMDSHNAGRGRGSVEAALAQVQAKTVVVSIQSDVLFPLQEQEFLAAHIPNARLEIFDSLYGHDGFLIESESITQVLRPVLNGIWQNGVSKKSNKTTAAGTPVLPGTERF